MPFFNISLVEEDFELDDEIYCLSNESQFYNGKYGILDTSDDENIISQPKIEAQILYYALKSRFKRLKFKIIQSPDLRIFCIRESNIMGNVYTWY